MTVISPLKYFRKWSTVSCFLQICSSNCFMFQRYLIFDFLFHFTENLIKKELDVVFRRPRCWPSPLLLELVLTHSHLHSLSSSSHTHTTIITIMTITNDHEFPFNHKYYDHGNFLLIIDCHFEWNGEKAFESGFAGSFVCSWIRFLLPPIFTFGTRSFLKAPRWEFFFFFDVFPFPRCNVVGFDLMIKVV